jgi:hypothetical protein
VKADVLALKDPNYKRTRHAGDGMGFLTSAGAVIIWPLAFSILAVKPRLTRRSEIAAPMRHTA